jgi:Na+-translocating ferredoxin:NAD+ oxidoreductase RnfG subunit
MTTGLGKQKIGRQHWQRHFWEQKIAQKHLPAHFFAAEKTGQHRRQSGATRPTRSVWTARDLSPLFSVEVKELIGANLEICGHTG